MFTYFWHFDRIDTFIADRTKVEPLLSKFRYDLIPNVWNGNMKIISQRFQYIH